jgi:methyltransferase (TIGR00027 family)
VLRPSSRTARLVALARAVGIDGLHDEVAQHVLPWRQAALVRRLRSGMDPELRRGRALRTLVGGLADHATLRMLTIDAVVAEAVAAGAGQVVVLGAGLDTRAWRLTELRDARVLELDLPRTQEDKRRRLGGVPPVAAEVEFVPADLDRVDLDWVLAHAGHREDRPTVWLAEGLVMYLHPEAIAATLTTLGRRSTPGSTVAVTFAVPELLGDAALGRRLEPAARGLFSVLGEPLRTLHTEEEMRTLLTDAGFTDVTTSTSGDWARRLGREPSHDAFAAEHLAVARSG